jgi:hypothetical protein
VDGVVALGVVEVMEAVVRASSRAFQAVPDAVGADPVGLALVLSDAVVSVVSGPGDRLIIGTAIRMVSAAPSIAQRRAVGGWVDKPANRSRTRVSRGGRPGSFAGAAGTARCRPVLGPEAFGGCTSTPGGRRHGVFRN